MHDYAGCIHFHSEYSYDCNASISSIVDAAHHTRLDFGILNDHFTLAARENGCERFYQKAGRSFLLLVGEEISPRYNHYLAFGLQHPVVIEKENLHPQDMIDAVNAQGGFGLIAHPDHDGAPLVGMRRFPWLHWNVTGYSGLAIWNLISDWARQLTSYPAIFQALLMPMHVLQGPAAATLSRWDELCQKQHCVAIGEIDNHASIKRYLGWKQTIFPFETAFRSIRTHVLLPETFSGEVSRDREMIFQAIRSGHSYVSFDRWNDPKGFYFSVFDDHTRVGMGESFERRGPALLEIKIPIPGRIRLIRDGRLIFETKNKLGLQMDCSLPGVYRVEVSQSVWGAWRPWIFSNPIWVK